MTFERWQTASGKTAFNLVNADAGRMQRRKSSSRRLVDERASGRMGKTNAKGREGGAMRETAAVTVRCRSIVRRPRSQNETMAARGWVVDDGNGERRRSTCQRRVQNSSGDDSRALRSLWGRECGKAVQW